MNVMLTRSVKQASAVRVMLRVEWSSNYILTISSSLFKVFLKSGIRLILQLLR